jgi:hypothetical protein
MYMCSYIKYCQLKLAYLWSKCKSVTRHFKIVNYILNCRHIIWIFVIFVLCQYPRVVWLVFVPRCTTGCRQYSDHFTYIACRRHILVTSCVNIRLLTCHVNCVMYSASCSWPKPCSALSLKQTSSACCQHKTVVDLCCQHTAVVNLCLLSAHSSCQTRISRDLNNNKFQSWPIFRQVYSLLSECNISAVIDY